jgi:hypothetical protein
MSRFDQDPAANYGMCTTCEIDIPTEQDGEAHMSETMKVAKDKRSHSIRVLNPSREHRIESAVEDIIDAAISTAMEEIDDLVQDGSFTEEEATEALRYQGKFSDAWEEYLAENA